jgi:hypothetical protein
MTDARRPVHLAVLAGTSVSLYAATLAAVATIQSSSDAAVIDARSPLEAATRTISLDHDALSSRLAQAEDAYGAAAAAYDRTRPQLDGVESTLDRLAGSVAAVSGSARSLPDRVALPSVTQTVVQRASSPAHVSTGPSGH